MVLQVSSFLSSALLVNWACKPFVYLCLFLLVHVDFGPAQLLVFHVFCQFLTQEWL